jgi:starvation-inducible outer membrane lipoprotein
MPINKILLLSVLLFSLSACSMVKLTTEGEKARVLSAAEVSKCTYVGRTTSTTTEKVVGVKRHDKALNLELVSLARNAARRLGGDTVVAEAPAKDGRQTFLVYRCIPQ